MQTSVKLNHVPRLLIALCTIVAACGSVSDGNDDDAQREREGETERSEETSPEAPAADAGSAGHAAVARECIGRVPEEEFCNGTAVQTCLDGSASVVRQCEERERCVSVRDRVACACEPGTVDTGAGCQVVAGCDTDRGGCDPLTECSLVADKRTCGACPAGYAGDGERGCEPLLTSLVADGGELTPAFSPDVRSYRVKLPPTRDQLSLTPVVGSDVQIEVDSMQLSSGSSWTSPALSPGEHAITLVLTAQTGITTRYEIVVERADS